MSQRSEYPQILHNKNGSKHTLNYQSLLGVPYANGIGKTYGKRNSKQFHSRLSPSTPNSNPPALQRIQSTPPYDLDDSSHDSPSYSLRDRKSRKRKRTYAEESWVCNGDLVSDNDEAFAKSISPSPPMQFDIESWEPENKESSDSDYEIKNKRPRKTKPRTPKSKPKIPLSPKPPVQAPKKRRRKLRPVPRPLLDEESDPEYLPSHDSTAPQPQKSPSKPGAPYKRRSRRGQVLGHVEDRRKKRKLPKKKRSPKKSKKKNKKKQKADSEKKVVPKIPMNAVPIRPAMIYGSEGRVRRNVERKDYAEPTYFWEPPPLPSHIEKPKPPLEKKKKNLVANPPNEKLFIMTHLRDDSTRVRLHQSKLFYKLEHDELPLTMIFANHDGHSEQLRSKNAGWKLLREQRSFHIPKTEGFAKKFVGILKFKETVVASVLFYPGCHDTKLTIRYFVTLTDYRNTGFGKILAVGIRQYIDHVFPSVHEIELWALNEAARAFWQSVGYNIVGKQKQKMRCHHHTKETPAYIQWAVFNCRNKMVDKGWIEPKPEPEANIETEKEDAEEKSALKKLDKPIIPTIKASPAIVKPIIPILPQNPAPVNLPPPVTLNLPPPIRMPPLQSPIKKQLGSPTRMFGLTSPYVGKQRQPLTRRPRRLQPPTIKPYQIPITIDQAMRRRHTFQHRTGFSPSPVASSLPQHR